MSADDKLDAFRNALTNIAEKNNTYIRPREFTCMLARVVLNTWDNCDYRISENYTYLIEEIEDDTRQG